MKKTCAICGNPSGMYPLCPDCFKLRDEGKVEKCEECGNWYLVENGCPNCEDGKTKIKHVQIDFSHSYKETEKVENIKHCPICNEEISEDKSLCSTCWKTAKKDYKEFEDPGQYGIRSRYFSQRNETYSIINDEHALKSKRVMAALAVQLYYEYDDNYILNRIVNDINNVEKARQTQKQIFEQLTKDDELEEEKTEEKRKTEIEDFRKAHPANIRCKDGHYVRSKSEKIIDDWLYDNDILHIYEKQIYVNNDGIETTYLPDFYLKKENIYIEFWGSTDKKYLEKRKEKEDFYNKNGYIIIGLEDKHIELIDDILPQEIIKAKRKNN